MASLDVLKNQAFNRRQYDGCKTSDDLRVTVVATGLTGSHASGETALKLVQKNTGEIDYEQLQRPAVHRRQPKHESRPEAAKEMDLDYLDIPAFLRRQAD